VSISESGGSALQVRTDEGHEVEMPTAQAKGGGQVRRFNPTRPVVKVALLAASILIVMTTSIIAPALPLIREHFADQTNVDFWSRLVLTLPALFIAGTAPIAGILVDRIGRKRVLISSVVLYGATGAASYLATSLPVLLFTRAALGVAVGGLITSVSVLIADYYSGVARAKFLGLQAGFMGLGASVFLVLGGSLAGIGWQMPFAVYFAAFALLPLLILVVSEPRPYEKCEEKPAPIGDPAECVAEALREGSVEAEESDGRKFPMSLAIFAYLLMMGTQIVFFLVPVQMPFYLRGLTQATAAQTGLALSTLTMAYALAALMYGRLAKMIDRFGILTLAFGLIGSGFLLLSLAVGWTMILAGLIVGGLGLGWMVPNLNLWLANGTPASVRGRAMGGLATALFLGQFLSPIISQPASSALGLGGVFLGTSGIFLVLAPLSHLTRRQLKHMTALPAA